MQGGGAAVGPVQVLEEDHLLFEAAAAKHTAGSTTVADPGATGQTGADAAESAEIIQTMGGAPPGQLDRSGRVLTHKTLRKDEEQEVITRPGTGQAGRGCSLGSTCGGVRDWPPVWRGPGRTGPAILNDPK